MADTTISSLNTVNALSANNFIPISDGTNTTKLGTDSLFGFRNRIINGDMRIWQRGTNGFTTTNSKIYVADRMWMFSGFGVTATASQVTNTELSGFPFATRLQRNSGNTGTSNIAYGQIIETANCQDLAGQTITVSFYARAGANYSGNFNTLQVYIVTGSGTDQGSDSFIAQTWTNQVFSLIGTVALTTSWQRFTLTYTVPIGTKEIGVYTNHVPLGIAGANDFHDVTGVQLEVGSTATPFERRPYGLELSLCHRYYNRITLAATDASLTQSFFDAAFWTGPTAFDGYCHAVYRYPVTMRTTAIATDFSDASTFWYHIGGVAQGVLTSIGGNALGPDRFRFSCRMSYNNGNGLAGQILARNGYTAYLGFSAEL